MTTTNDERSEEVAQVARCANKIMETLDGVPFATAMAAVTSVISSITYMFSMTPEELGRILIASVVEQHAEMAERGVPTLAQEEAAESQANSDAQPKEPVAGNDGPIPVEDPHKDGQD